MGRMGRSMLLLLAVTSLGAHTSEAQGSAFATDDECLDLSNSSRYRSCALSAMQFRGQRRAAQGVLEGGVEQRVGSRDSLERGSCREYGCSSGYVKEHSCQCNSPCTAHGNCCPDYWAQCSGSSSGSCKAYGCVGYAKDHLCQCNAECDAHGNCCQDYAAQCSNPKAQQGGSCKEYGCVGYTRDHACQCNAECRAHGSCCRDYAAQCEVPARQGTCKAYGCVGFVKEHACQCNSKCQAHGNCCADYSAQCASGPPPTGRHSAGRGPPYGHPTPGKAYPQRKGFTLYLVEEFDAPLNLDTDPIWTWSDGGLELEGQVRFVRDAITFGGGQMHIAVDHYRGQHLQSCSMAEKGHISHKPLTGGEFRTRYNLFRYGFYEARIQAPRVQASNPNIEGNYIASFFAYHDSKFDHWREIDIELLGNHPGAYSTNILSADGVSDWNENIEDADIHYKTETLNLRNGFHTIAFEWLPYRVRWFIDGKVVREYRDGGKLPIPSKPAKIMMNLWVFIKRVHAFGGLKVENNQYPMRSKYDWFRFYKWDGDASYPCPAMNGDCLGPEDKRLSSNNPCDGIPQVGTVHGKVPCHAVC